MISMFLALTAALTAGLAVVLVQKRLDESKFFSVVFVATVIGNIIIWPLVLLFINLGTVKLEGVLFFVASGLLAPGITRLLYFRGMEVVGVSVSASVFAAYPMYSSILAALLLGEALTTENWIGIICIVVGVVFIERRISEPSAGHKRNHKKGLIFPLLASAIRAFSAIARKYGLNVYNEPLLGVAIGFFSSLLLYLLLLFSSRSVRKSLFLVKDFRLFWKAGFCMSLAWVLVFYALSHEKVSIVNALTQTQPLFVLFFACLYLKKLEDVSFKLIMGTLLIVIGAVLIGIH